MAAHALDARLSCCDLRDGFALPSTEIVTAEPARAMHERPSSPHHASSPQERTMAETPPTPNTPKSAIKADQYVSPTKPAQPRVEKSDQTEAAKTGRAATAVRTDQPVHRLMTVTITIDAESAEVVRVEGVDATGARHELSEEEKTSIVKERRDEHVAELVEQAFEAGIASVLGVDEEEETTQESPEDTELRHQLLAPLIERSALRHLTERAALNRAILGTLIEHSMKK